MRRWIGSFYRNRMRRSGSPYQIFLLHLFRLPCHIYLFFEPQQHISVSSFTFPGSPKQIFFLYLFRLPCHLYLVIEQQYLAQLDATFLIVKVRNRNPWLDYWSLVHNWFISSSNSSSLSQSRYWRWGTGFLWQIEVGQGSRGVSNSRRARPQVPQAQG